MLRSTSRRGVTVAALAGAVAMASACSSGTPSAAPVTTAVTAAPSATSPAPASSTTAPAPARPSPSPSPSSAPGPCRAADLHVTIGHSNGGTGSIDYAIRFANVSRSACTLYGYPGVSVVAHPGGRRIGATAQEIRWVPRKLVTVARGGSASAFLRVAGVSNLSPACDPAAGHWVKVYPPGQFRAQYARRTVSVCTMTGSAGYMGVSAVRAGGNGG